MSDEHQQATMNQPVDSVPLEGRYYAHSPRTPGDRWEPLEDHLGQVAELAARFAAAFESDGWGRLAGMWHDLGKYRAEFQRRIRGERIQVPHAGVGAVIAYRELGVPPLAFAIAGHHAGLANHEAQADTAQQPLRRIVEDNAPVLSAIRQIIPGALLHQSRPDLPSWLRTENAEEQKTRVELWTRFLLSALVDADRLATEAFYEPAKRDSLTYDPVSALRERIDTHLDALVTDTPVKVQRAAVLDRCRHAAMWRPGLFSLTAPTGSGKTLSSMSFALRHAVEHGLRRVIVVAPYTSIIEQNAQVFRGVLGDENVIEHHSGIDEEAREQVAPEAEIRRRLAAENWEAPIIVTTAVQFFESLLSNEPSRCRRLHNVAGSVIVIDEAQLLPAEYLLALLDVMRQLTSHYGCSLLLSTATQPALAARDALPQGLTGVREIMTDPAGLAAGLRRIAVRWPEEGSTLPIKTIAERMGSHLQVLTIVHSRSDARRIGELLSDDGRFHLSTRMCAAHRLATLDAIREALASERTCRVVATQLVEAGVDVDFPVVYRAMAGLDSLTQAAGRCNRSGLLQSADGQPALGEFVVFRAESLPPRGILRRGLAVAEQMLRSAGSLDLTNPATLEEYFRALYFGSQLDEHGVMAQRRALNFATVADRVRFIRDGTRPLVVPFANAAERVRTFEESLQRASGIRKAARALQPFVVQLYPQELRLLEQQGAVTALEGFGNVLVPPFLHLYSREFGLTLDGDAVADAGDLIA
jgi:CRISPR-associated endonuclease/helicase Cas3